MFLKKLEKIDGVKKEKKEEVIVINCICLEFFDDENNFSATEKELIEVIERLEKDLFLLENAVFVVEEKKKKKKGIFERINSLRYDKKEIITGKNVFFFTLEKHLDFTQEKMVEMDFLEIKERKESLLYFIEEYKQLYKEHF